jgi:hypothetical protein
VVVYTHAPQPHRSRRQHLAAGAHSVCAAAARGVAAQAAHQQGGPEWGVGRCGGAWGVCVCVCSLTPAQLLQSHEGAVGSIRRSGGSGHARLVGAFHTSSCDRCASAHQHPTHPVACARTPLHDNRAAGAAAGAVSSSACCGETSRATTSGRTCGASRHAPAAAQMPMASSRGSSRARTGRSVTPAASCRPST